MQLEGVRAREGSGGLYPLWLGLAATAILTGVWLVAAPIEAPAVALADLGVLADLGAAETEVETPAADAPGLSWTVTGAPAPTTPALAACLRARVPESRPLVLGEAPRWTLTFAGLALPQSLVAEDAPGAGNTPTLVLRTPLVGDRRAVTQLHVATAHCLRAPGAVLRDGHLDRDFTGARWPDLGPSGGAPAGLLVRVERQGEAAARTRGLDRLGRSEVGVAMAPGAEGLAGAEALLLQAAATLLASDRPPPLLALSGAPALTLRPAAGVAAWPQDPPPPAGLRVLVTADGTLYVAPTARPAPRVTEPARPEPRPPTAAPATATGEPAARPRPRPRPGAGPGAGAGPKPGVARPAASPAPTPIAPARPAGPRTGTEPGGARPRQPASRPAFLPDYR